MSDVSLFTVCMFILGLAAGLPVSALVLGLPAVMERRWCHDALQTLGELSVTECTPKPALSLIPDQINLRFMSTVLATALLSTWVTLHYGFTPVGIAGFVLASGLLTLSLIDIDHQLLPDVVVLPLLWLGLIVNSFGLFTTLHSALWGAIIGYLFLWCLRGLSKMVTGNYGMGQGDLKLLAMLGAWGGWQVLPGTLLISTLTGAVVGGMLMGLGKIDRTTPMSFGPYLAGAGWLALLYTPDWFSM